MRQKFGAYRFLQIACVMFLVGTAVLQFRTRDQWFNFRTTDSSVVLEGTVAKRVSENGWWQTVNMKSAYAGEVVFPKFVRVRLLGVPVLRVGDRLRVECVLKNVKDARSDSFRFDRWLMKEGVSVLCDAKSSGVVVGKNWDIQTRLGALRERLSFTIQRALPEPHASLLSGLLYGDIVDMQDEVKMWFQRTGTLHLVAVSGSNVSLVTEAMLFLLIAIGFRRKFAFWILLLALFSFVILTGAEASVVRAGCMGALLLSAKQIGRPSASLSLFLLTMSVMVAISPRLLLDDIGFRLSFAAVAGMMWLAPVIQKRFVFFKDGNTKKLLSETLAAILATLPFSVFSFGSISLVAPIANILVLPIVPVVMALGAILLVSSVVLRVFFVMPILLWLPVYAILEYILLVARLLSPLPVWRVLV